MRRGDLASLPANHERARAFLFSPHDLLRSRVFVSLGVGNRPADPLDQLRRVMLAFQVGWLDVLPEGHGAVALGGCSAHDDDCGHCLIPLLLGALPRFVVLAVRAMKFRVVQAPGGVDRLGDPAIPICATQIIASSCSPFGLPAAGHRPSSLAPPWQSRAEEEE